MIHGSLVQANANNISKSGPSNVPTNTLKILMLEDNVNDAELIEMYLKTSPFKLEFILVSNKQEYIDAIQNEEFDVILSDHNIPQFSSLEALRIRNQLRYHVPFILVTGSIPEEYAVTILQEGANDYILKDRPQRLINAITEAIKKQRALADKQQAEEELIRSEQRFRYLIENSTAMLTLSNGEGIFTYISPNIKNILGYEWGNSPDKGIKIIHPDDAHIYRKIFVDLRQNPGVTYPFTYRIKQPNNTWKWIEGTVVNLLHIPEVNAVVTNFRDISEKKKLEENLVLEKILHQKQNTEIAIQSQEAERKNIGKELHDNINQLMAFAKMMIDTSRNSPELREICIDKSYEGINMAIEEVRKLSHTLVPPAFRNDNSFIEAINDIVQNIQLSGKLEIAINIPTNGKFKIADEKIKLTFYRIIQEQLNNILKYSKADHASISVNILQDAYQLIISDNGIGFDCEKKSKGIGLKNIASRSELHSGKMEIIAAPGKGCTLKIEIPFSE